MVNIEIIDLNQTRQSKAFTISSKMLDDRVGVRIMVITQPSLDWHSPFQPVIDTIKWLGEGAFCRCYVVNQTHVVRVAKHREASIALEREIKLLPQLSAYLHTPIPTIQGWGIESNSGQAFIYYPILAGVPLERDILEGLEAHQQAHLLQQIAAFFQHLHRIPVEIGAALGLTHQAFNLSVLLDRAQLPLTQHFAPHIWDYYQQLATEYRTTPALRHYTPSLLHGDLSPEHIVIDREQCGLSGVIDFGDSCIGDPLWDFIYILEDYGASILETILETYAPETAHQAFKRIQIYQHFNNLEYYLSQLEAGDTDAIAEATTILINQAEQ